MGFKLPWRLLIPPRSVDTVIGADSGLELGRKTGATVQLVFREVFDVDGPRVRRHGKWQKFHFCLEFCKQNVFAATEPDKVVQQTNR